MAGFPATMTPAETFFVTTLPAATTASLPIVTPLRIIEREPTQTLSSKRTAEVLPGS